MLVTIIAYNLCTVNRNAIVLLTEYQKYYGEKLLYQRSTKSPGFFVLFGKPYRARSVTVLPH